MDKNTQNQIFAHVDAIAEDLTAMSRAIWAHPELGYEERFAAKTLTDYLSGRGFAVERNVSGYETAFVARKGDGKGPCVAFVAEYDALPQLGHACGHNLYCCSAVGAAVALDELTGGKGLTIMVAGTPAEETCVKDASGKVKMTQDGVFDGVDIAMMCHAEDSVVIERTLVAVTSTSAVFHGKSAHAGGSPEKGINALTAGMLTLNNINALRQHFVAGNIVNGIITKGGVMANTIPDECELLFSIRAASKEERDELSEKVDRCLRAAAMVTGCTVDIEKTPNPYDDTLPNHRLGLSYRRALMELGYQEEEILQSDRRSYGWDFGNISHVCPGLAPYMKIGPVGLVGHTDEFRECSNSPMAYKSLLDAAKSLCYTAWDYLSDPEMQREVREEFEKNN
ncbi:MAG: M20 family metallopeptidase [Oscillospiraceae bacterium]|nr:M20 family metallopeptidase [Oscillospiraceae bacterium]